MMEPQSFEDFLRHYWNVHTDMLKMFMMGLLGLFGGLVRICSDGRRRTWRQIGGSILVSMFAGSLIGAMFHNHLRDPMYFGALCSLGGYAGHGTLFAISNWIEKRTGVRIEVDGGKR